MLMVAVADSLALTYQVGCWCKFFPSLWGKKGDICCTIVGYNQGWDQFTFISSVQCKMQINQFQSSPVHFKKVNVQIQFSSIHQLFNFNSNPIPYDRYLSTLTCILFNNVNPNNINRKHKKWFYLATLCPIITINGKIA